MKREFVCAKCGSPDGLSREGRVSAWESITVEAMTDGGLNVVSDTYRGNNDVDWTDFETDGYRCGECDFEVVKLDEFVVPVLLEGDLVAHPDTGRRCIVLNVREEPAKGSSWRKIVVADVLPLDGSDTTDGQETHPMVALRKWGVHDDQLTLKGITETDEDPVIEDEEVPA